MIFADPARGIRGGKLNPTIPTPLPAAALTEVASAAAEDVVLRAVVALTGIHALQPAQIRLLRLDQINLRDRRLDLDGTDRLLDEFTVAAISDYLTYRRNRWPRATNPYPPVTRKTVHTGEPVSRFWPARRFQHLPVTAEDLREDRIVEEALAGRPDPLHLAAVFGFTPKTALRYMQAVRPDPEPTDAAGTGNAPNS